MPPSAKAAIKLRKLLEQNHVPNAEEIMKALEKPRAREGVGVVSVVPSSTGLVDLLDEAMPLRKVVQVWCEQMEANTHFQGPQGLIQKPDGKTRLAAVELWLAYREGRPIERRIIENHNIDSLDDLEKKLASSPALCDELAKRIEAARLKRIDKPMEEPKA